MRRFKLSGDTFHIKEDIKKLIPKGTRAFWKFEKKDKSWIITLQDQFASNKYRKLINTFAENNNLVLSETNWDGWNKKNNYV